MTQLASKTYARARCYIFQKELYHLKCNGKSVFGKSVFPVVRGRRLSHGKSIALKSRQVKLA